MNSQIAVHLSHSAKAQLEFRLAMNVKDNQKSSYCNIRNKRLNEKNVGLPRNEMVYLVNNGHR